MMTRWLSYIRLFDFDVEHIPGNKNGAADALSRRMKSEDDEMEEEVDGYFEARMYGITVAETTPEPSMARLYLHEGEYIGDDLMLGQYLETLRRPDGLNDAQYQQLRKKARRFFVRDGYLFKRGRKRGFPPRRVVGTQDQRLEVIRELHDEIGHRGKQSTYDHVSRRYQWKNMYADVEKWVKTCERCQRRARNRYEEPLHPTWSTIVWEKIGVDVVYMPWDPGGGYIVFARDDLSGWVEARAINAANSSNVAKFLYEDVICRHGCPRHIVLDGGRENLDLTKDLIDRYHIKGTVVSAFHPQANGLVERGHDPIVNSLAKYCHDTPTDWVKFLPLALWADRISVRRSTGYSAFELVYGRECLLPIEFAVRSWAMIHWENVDSREDLILARMRQLDQRKVQEAHAADNLRDSRMSNKGYFDQIKRLRSGVQQLQVGDLVLVYIDQHRFWRARQTKLSDKWRGPYRIREVAENSTFYRLEELDGVLLAPTFAGNRLKKFFMRDEQASEENSPEISSDQGTSVEEGMEHQEDPVDDSNDEIDEFGSEMERG
jgi:hypothetical protein